MQYVKVIDPRNPLNPSVPCCPGGKAAYIVFFRQSAPGKEEPDWVLERTSDGAVMESGTLAAMLKWVGSEKYPHSRRSTWAEDTLRFRPSFLDY